MNNSELLKSDNILLSGFMSDSDLKTLEKKASRIANLAKTSSIIDEKLVSECENLTLFVRNTVKMQVKLTNNQNKNLNKRPNVKLFKDNDGIHIALDRLLPSRKSSTQYIWDTYYQTLKKIKQEIWKDNYNYPDKKTIIIYCHYDNINSSRDYDNYDIKSMTDVITGLFLKDDSPKYVDIYHTSRNSEYKYTCIHLVSESNFTNFISKSLDTYNFDNFFYH